MQNPYFTGRDDILERVHGRLAATPEGTLGLHALQGLGGIGKTQLAIEYAHRFSGEYDLVWWISAEDPSVTRASLAALADALGVGGADFTIAGRNALEALRLGRPHGRWLLVYDNAAEPDAIAEFLPAGGGHVLVTSRGGQWRYGAVTMEVDVFDRAESTAFLTQRVEGLSPGDADLIADALGDLPLALEQAAALQVESGISAEEFIRELRERGRTLFAVLNENPPVGYPLTVATVWAMSVEHLRVHSADALELLGRLAFFGPEPVPLAIFTEARRVLDGEFGEILGETLRLQRALRGLSRYSLARVDTVRNTVQVHRLMQTVRRHELSEADADRIRHDVHVLLSARAPADPDDSDTWHVYNGFLGHVMRSGALACGDPDIRRFCVNIARYLYVRGDYEGSREFAEQAIEQWTREPAEAGRDPRADPHVLSMRLVLGVDLRLLGELPAAHTLNGETLELMRSALGAEHEETLRIMNSHGGDLRALGRFDRARELDEASLELHRRVLGADDPWTMMATNNLAVDYRLTGVYSEALRLDQDALARRLALYRRPDNHWVLFSRNNVARDLRELGEYAESLRLQREVRADYRSMLHADHPNVLRASKNLSLSLRKAGLFAEARAEAEEVRERYEHRFGPGHLDTLAACCNFVNDLRIAGELEEARKLGEETLSRYRGALGAEHPFTYGCAVNLGAVLRRLGLAADAARLDLHAREGLLATVGPGNLYTLTATAGLANDRAALGDLDGAVRLGEEAVRGFTESFDGDHPHTLASIVNLAADLRAAGEEERGAELGADAVPRLARRIGADHPLAVAAARGERLDFDFEPPPV